MRPQVVLPDQFAINKTHAEGGPLLLDGTCMTFTDDEKFTWNNIVDDFIVNIDKRKRVKHFIESMHSAKMETER